MAIRSFDYVLVLRERATWVIITSVSLAGINLGGIHRNYLVLAFARLRQTFNFVMLSRRLKLSVAGRLQVRLTDIVILSIYLHMSLL